MRVNEVKARLRAGQVQVGAWLTLGSLTAARLLARAGFDWLTLDLEHGPWDWQAAAETMGAIADAGCVPLLRVPSNRHDHLKRALDLGAMGVVVPMVNSRAEAEAAINACKYPPHGSRSVGGSVAALNFAASAGDYLARANEELLLVLQCEHIESVGRLDDICSVAGLDAIFVGPNDLAASLRAADGTPATAKMQQETQTRILETCQRHRLPVGIHCFSAEEARRRADAGWQLLAVNSDLRFLMEGAALALKPFRADGLNVGNY